MLPEKEREAVLEMMEMFMKIDKSGETILYANATVLLARQEIAEKKEPEKAS